MARVLVTGASGFVGRQAVSALAARGFEVHGTSRDRAAQVVDAIMHAADVLDAKAAAALVERLRPSDLLLSAWTTAHGQYWTDPANDAWIEASAALAQAFFASGGRRVVLVGTCGEYDWSDPALARGPIKEDAAQGAPHTPYGRAKRAVARTIEALASTAGGSFADGRIFFPMGPGEDRRRLLPTIMLAIAAEQPAELGPGDLVRDVIDVRDAGAALAALVDSQVAGAVNVGTGRAIRLGDLARRAGEIGGRPDLIRIGTRPARAGEPAMLVADIGRLRGLGFSPRHDLDDTLSTAFAYWRNAKDS